jgi:DNA-binding LacI/PurR family transcriptional regulator
MGLCRVKADTVMKPTLNDIARRTGLSIATISRALHSHGSRHVSRETRDMVQRVASDVGYRPNLLSRSLVKGKSHIVSYWTFDAFAPYYAKVAREISRQAVVHGYAVHIHNTIDPARSLEPDGLGVGIDSALSFSMDGVIACDVAYTGNRYAASLHRPNIPLVGIGLNYPEDCDSVGIDLTSGTEEAMEHLFAQGCRRIAHFSFADALVRQDPRACAYHDRMRSAGLSPEWIPVISHRRRDARVAIQHYVQKHGAPEAIFCANDEVAIGCYRGLADLGIEVPSRVRLIGCDGIEDAEFQRCPLTTIEAPVEKMCEIAWQMLEERIRTPDAPLQQIVLKPTLRIRESTTG